MILQHDDEAKMNSDEVKTEYTNSLADLTFNSKPLINMLTMLAEENSAHARVIVAAIEEHLSKVQTDVKLPILYLIDCIAKNIGGSYSELFSQNIVMTFCSVFKLVDEKTRSEMFKLRQTWNSIFPQKKLYAIDVQIHMLDPAWPVTAPPPSNSIYFNPKFLKSTTSSSTGTTTTTTTTLANKLATSDLTTKESEFNSETLEMQQKLIQKQQELIELQQRKLELELLQTQVKLQNQKKNQNLPATGPPGNKPNILLKPEVAKQLMPNAQKRTHVNAGSRIATANSQTGPTHRITPANSALVAAVTSQARPAIRDPRLIRQQQQQQQKSSTTNNNLGSKSTDSSNKIVTNKVSVRDLSRNEPRLVNNNNNANKDKIQSSNTSPTTPPSSTMSTISKPKIISPKSRLDQKFSSNKRNKSDSSDKVSTIQSTSPTKKQQQVQQLQQQQNDKSPTKQHKKSSINIENKKLYKESSSNKRDIRENKHILSSKDPQTSFKGVKGSTKNRNYMRRNRSPSPLSPAIQPQDVDLRLVGPPEKQPRLQDMDEAGIVKTQDVDLRQLPGPIAKKRPSTEALVTDVGGVSKKSKSGVFDVLFGNEDTDLRQLPGVGAIPAAPVLVDRPPTPPPPPIISDTKEEPKKTSNFDAIRAKLANATNRDKVLAKSFRKKPAPVKVTIPEDEDLRNNSQKFIVSPAEFNGIQSGDMTDEQKAHLMNKIIAQMEHRKLVIAQMKDNEENSATNVSLQPISDEELEIISDETRTDRDDRYYNKYQGRELRRGGQFWRGVKRRAAQWDGPRVRGGVPVVSGWHPPGWRPVTVPPYLVEEDKKSPEVAGDLVVDAGNQDDIKTINIDGIPRDIRYYDEAAIIFMSWDDPREISFQDGTRRVIFDDKDIYLLQFNSDYQEISIGGELHKVRLGGPSREIFIDSRPYECYFGGPGITIDLNGRMTTVKLDGPPPQVKIGQVKRVDLVAGKVNLIIDAKILVPVYLDAKLQKFVIDGETHTLKFVDALKTVLINDVPFTVEFGGLPKPITVHDKKHFIRFSVLPRGIKPGYVSIKDMEGAVGIIPVDLSPLHEDENSQDIPIGVDGSSEFAPLYNVKKKIQNEDELDRNSDSPSFSQEDKLNLLSSVLTSNTPKKGSNSGYKVENIENSSTIEPPLLNPVTHLPPNFNINELFQKLVATGIVATNDSTPTPQQLQPQQAQQQQQPPPQQQAQAEPPRKRTLEVLKMKFVSFDKVETLKTRQGALYEALYAGMQCSSCGMRFPPEQTMHYSQHLDWHFRQNRKGKKNIRVAASRKWYYSLSDWKNYEEIEDLEEREKNYFDQQQSQIEGPDENDEEVEIPSVPADPEVQDPHCEVCEDRFDQYFNEEKEEWHLRNGIRIDGKTYHPVCYEDHLNSLLEKKEEPEPDPEPVVETIIPGLEIVLDDDEEEVEEVQKVEDDDEVIIEESDESNKPVVEEKLEEVDLKSLVEEGDDDDVIINEVVPEKIVVNDDYEYEDVHKNDSTPVPNDQINDNGFVEVEEGVAALKSGVKIKSEPLDPDEITEEMVLEEELAREPLPPTTTYFSSIDGNTEIATTSAPSITPITIGGKIKINITKALPVITAKETSGAVKESGSESANSNVGTTIMEPVLDPSQPLPPGEEPIQLNVKPALRDVELKKFPTVRKGRELTGMCSIM